jgi:hypothetical protein
LWRGAQVAATTSLLARGKRSPYDQREHCIANDSHNDSRIEQSKLANDVSVVAEDKNLPSAETAAHYGTGQ